MSIDRFLKGVQEFNSELFFECHDTLEEIWNEERNPEIKKFYHGLIHIAVGFYHLTNLNFRGATSQLKKAIAKLNDYPEIYMNVKLSELLSEVKLWLLIGFGVAYAIWGLKHARHPHKHEIVDEKILNKKVVTVWTLFAIFVLGPCEPLIPLFFISLKFKLAGILTVVIVFSVVTWLMMIGQALIGYLGIRLINFERLERYSHTIAGVVIALTGIFILISGI